MLFWNKCEPKTTIYHMEMAHFLLPSKLDLTDVNLADSFRQWKAQLDVYLEASGTTNKPKQRHTGISLHCAGQQVLEVNDHFQFDREEEKKIPRKSLKILKSTATREKTEFPFCEPFDVLLTELYSRAA